MGRASAPAAASPSAASAPAPAVASCVDFFLVDLGGVVLDEGEAVLGVAAHQPVDEVGGHDDDSLVAQALDIAALARAAADRLGEIGDLLVGSDLVGGRRGDIEDLAADRKDRLGLAVARLLGRTAGRIALDDEQF